MDILLKRGSSKALDNYKGLFGELTIDSDNNIRIMDGSTTGGIKLVKTYTNGLLWYRQYSDGWLEQGGTYNRGTSDTAYNYTISFLKSFSNTNYSLITDHIRKSTGTTAYQIKEDGYQSKTSSSFTLYRTSQPMYDGGTSWYACGY